MRHFPTSLICSKNPRMSLFQNGGSKGESFHATTDLS
jgi:hypothetical protein